MLITFRTHGRTRGALWRFVSVLALLAQCWMAAAPLGEAHGIGASAHVESSGTRQHYTHDEADCAACRTLALTPLPLRESPRVGAAVAPGLAVVAPPGAAPRAVEPVRTRSRAPPLIA